MADDLTSSRDYFIRQDRRDAIAKAQSLEFHLSLFVGSLFSTAVSGLSVTTWEKFW